MMIQIFKDVDKLQNALAQRRLAGEKIGLVPTMGALHNGHASLVKASMDENECTVVSIFVNPLQFNNEKDLETYPRNEKSDVEFLEKLGCQMVFIPDVNTIYPHKPRTKFSFGKLETAMEGEFRDGHFNGVATVISKLFHIVAPDHAYFGQKDLQQYLIIETLVNDLEFRLQLRCVPIVREESGLAISSRNQRLSKGEKDIARHLFRALNMGEMLLREGNDIISVKKEITSYLSQWQEICLEYYELVNKNTLEFTDTTSKKGEYALCLAAYVGSVRLIDNIIFII